MEGKIGKLFVPYRIVKHFMNTCVDPDILHKYLRFIIIDSVNNTEDLGGRD